MKLKPIGYQLALRLAVQLAFQRKLPTGNQVLNASIEELINQWNVERGVQPSTTTPDGVQN